MHMITVKPFRLSSASDLASLGRATARPNSAPLTAADLQGKVVLVDFWNYTCIIGFAHSHTSAPGPRGTKNKGWSSSACTHQNSRLRKTSTTCERPHRREASRIPLPSTTTARSGVGSAITIGWRSTSSMRRRVRDHHFGEGNYEESEMRVRQLLAAAGTVGGIDCESVSVEAHGQEVGADWAA